MFKKIVETIISLSVIGTEIWKKIKYLIWGVSHGSQTYTKYLNVVANETKTHVRYILSVTTVTILIVEQLCEWPSFSKPAEVTLYIIKICLLYSTTTTLSPFPCV